jgi:hypothetical protein
MGVNIRRKIDSKHTRLILIMTWKEAWKEVKEDTDVVLPDGSRIELIYPALIIALFVIIVLPLIS